MMGQPSWCCGMDFGKDEFLVRHRRQRRRERLYQGSVADQHHGVYRHPARSNTASWIYYGRREEGGRLLSPEGKRVEVPTGCALFPAELLAWPPRSYAERIYNVTQWTEMPRGGHFAAMEQPDLLIQDIRKFVRSIK